MDVSRIDSSIADRIDKLDLAELRSRFHAQDEFLLIDDFLPGAILDQCIAALPTLDPVVNRNYIPRHKKGGSVSRHNLDAGAPLFGALYSDTALMKFLNDLTDQQLKFCPPDDPHTYALYYYTEPGDHIGYHYDTSYYRGRRYTVLFGLVNESSCKLEFQLYRDQPDRETETSASALRPGMFIIFNGDKLYHRVTPLGSGERRIVLTLEYLTSTKMHPFRRFVSNMKDAIAYFGFRQVFGKNQCAR